MMELFFKTLTAALQRELGPEVVVGESTPPEGNPKSPLVTPIVGPFTFPTGLREEETRREQETLTLGRDFSQEFRIKVTAGPETPKWVSLVTGILLLDREALVAAYNQDAEAGYQAGDNSARHYLRSFRLLEGIPTDGGSKAAYELRFQVEGRFEFCRRVKEEAPRIKEIVKEIKVAKN